MTPTLPEPIAKNNARLGFFAGFRSVFSGFAFLFRTPKAWPYAMLPAIVLGSLSLFFGWLGVWAARSLIEGWVGTPESWYGEAGAGLLSWLGAILAAILGILI